MKVDNAEHRVVCRLHLAPLQQRAGVIAEVQRLGTRLHSRKQALAGHVNP
jgi:hypothetical protein